MRRVSTRSLGSVPKIKTTKQAILDCTHVFLFGGEGELADVERLEFVVGLQVRPAPHAAVDHVRQALPVRHLETAVQAAGDGDTFAGLAGAGESLQLYCVVKYS